eukprot:s1325_g10.t4
MAADAAVASVKRITAVIGGLSRSLRWRDALRLAEVQCRRQRHDTALHNAAIQAAAHGNLWPKALDIFEKMENRDSITFNSLVTALSNGSRLDRAIRFVQEAHKAGFSSELLPWSVLVAACGKALQWQRALFLGVEQSDWLALAPTLVACTRASRWEMSVALWASRPSGHSLQMYGAAVHAAKVGHQWPLALSIHDKMLKQSLLANTVINNSVMSALSKEGLWQEALVILQEMQDAECPDNRPDVITYNSAIAACERAWQWTAALQLFVQMRKERLKISSISCNSLLSALEKGRCWIYALHLLARMSRWRLHNQVSYNAVASACEKSWQWRRALLFCHGMDVVACNVSINACEKGLAWQLALFLLSSSRRGSLVDVPTFTTALTAAEKASQWQHAMLIFQVMRSRSPGEVGIDAPSLSACIRAAERSLSWSLALHVLRASDKECVEEVVLGSAAAALSACGQWELALSVLQEMRNREFSISNVSCCAAMNGCYHARQWQMATALLTPRTSVIGVMAAANACELSADLKETLVSRRLLEKQLFWTLRDHLPFQKDLQVFCSEAICSSSVNHTSAAAFPKWGKLGAVFLDSKNQLAKPRHEPPQLAHSSARELLRVGYLKLRQTIDTDAAARSVDALATVSPAWFKDGLTCIALNDRCYLGLWLRCAVAARRCGWQPAALLAFVVHLTVLQEATATTSKRFLTRHDNLDFAYTIQDFFEFDFTGMRELLNVSPSCPKVPFSWRMCSVMVIATTELFQDGPPCVMALCRVHKPLLTRLRKIRGSQPDSDEVVEDPLLRLTDSLGPFYSRTGLTEMHLVSKILVLLPKACAMEHVWKAAMNRAEKFRLLYALLLLLSPLVPSQDSAGHVKVSLAGQCDVAFTWSTPHADLAEVHYAPVGHPEKGKVVKSQQQKTWQNRSWLRATANLQDARSYDIKVSGLTLGPLHLPPCQLGNTTSEPSEGRTGRTADAESSRIAVVGELGLNASVLSRMQSDFDAVLHLGDLANSLAQAAPQSALDFLEMLQPVASRMPYMALPGDQDELEIYQLLFAGNPWYSFTAGHVKFIVLWTDAIVDLGTATPKWQLHQAAATRQLQWLEKQLQLANTFEAKSQQPWVVVVGHRPIYCSVLRPTCSSEAARLRSVLEPLLVKYKVDLYLSSHVNVYERTFRVLNGSVCTMDGTAACGPVHILNGDAGDPPLQYADLPARFTAQRHPGQPGYGELMVNATTLQYRQLDALSGITTDQLLLTKTVVELPAEEENFLEAVGWLAFATALATGTCGFVKWVHADGLKRRNEALRHLRTEIAVLSGLPIKASHEAEFLVSDAHGSHGLH